MTTAASKLLSARSAAKRAKHRTPRPILLSIGTSVPHLPTTQEEAAERLAAIWKLSGTALERWRRIVAGSDIRTRYTIMPPDEVAGLTTAQRMIEYERHAPKLAAAAARQALMRAGISTCDVTDLIVVSCTGFSAPGIDVALVNELGLAPTVRRSLIGFMGCFGAITGLRAAAGACAANANPRPIALLVCVELCSLHIRSDDDVQNQVASALFADGAAAAVVSGHVERAFSDPSRSSPPNHIGQLTTGNSLLLREGADWMTWRITDAGFAMTLTRDVPPAIQERLAAFVASSAEVQPQTYIVHPGGPGILEAVDAALALRGGAGLDASRTVLRDYGNVSSGSVLFVLDEALRRGCRLPAMLLAFGPGLTIESLTLLPSEQRPV